MSKVKQYLEIISAECDECGGAGFVFWGNENDSDALTAVHSFDKCSDFGDAKEYATYNLSEPNGKMHTKNFYRNGKVSTK